MRPIGMACFAAAVVFLTSATLVAVPVTGRIILTIGERPGYLIVEHSASSD